MARTQSLSIGLVFLLGCASAPKARQAPRAQEGVARPAPASAETKLFQSPDGDFQLQYPASWELEPNTPDLKFHARALFGLVNANVTTEQLLPGTTLDAFVDNSLAQLENLAGIEVKPPVERTSITLGETPAVRLGIVAKMPPSMNVPVDVHFDILAAVVNGKGYALTCVTGNTAVAIMKPVFDRIITSMRFTK